MKRLLLIVLLALLGLAVALRTIWQDSAPAEGTAIGLPSFSPPYESYIAGTGLVEAAKRNIPVGSNLPGVVTDVFVKPGDQVAIGTPLFALDSRSIDGQLLVAAAKVRVAKAAYQRAQHHLDIAERLKAANSNATSQEKIVDQQDEVAERKAELNLAEEDVARLKLDKGFYTVKARMAGVILKVDLQPGQYMPADTSSQPPMVLGGGSQWNLRVDINEQDAWRFRPDTDAVAYLRGHPDLKIKLHYAYTEPYVTPKLALTGVSTERTDTRILQIVYRIEPTDISLYVGQQLDVFIQAPAMPVSKPGR